MTTKQERATIGMSGDEKYTIPSPPLTPFCEISGLTSGEVSEALGVVTIGVSSPAERRERVERALAGETQKFRYDFPSVESLFATMTSKRWELLRRMVGAGPLTVEDLARRLERDPDAVYLDVQALLGCGVLYSTEDRRIIFPFSGLHINVMLQAAA